MADFVQTMKDWRRMCMAMEKLHPYDACNGCRLKGYGCPAIYEDNSHVDFRDVEKQVSAWAAEHPEPVYPTLAECLAEIGVFGPFKDIKTDFTEIEILYRMRDMMFKPISADIAQKLGIQPKEGI